MDTAKVYFTTMDTPKQDSIPAKLTRLLEAAGLAQMNPKDKFIAIKTHFGEMGNVSYLKPVYARTIAQAVKAHEGRPFVTDCSTLYPGMRANALDHLECAAMNGFSKDSCACPVIIADGLTGHDEVEVPVPQGGRLESALFGRAFFDADAVITLTHAKGCGVAAYGGAIKNISMGCASKSGKMALHCEGKPIVIEDACLGCGFCLKACGQDAIKIYDHKAHIADNCAGCGHCITTCTHGAIVPDFREQLDLMQNKMAEYAAAFVSARPCLHVAIAVDITAQCDCFADNGAPVLPNIGMFASTDPVALDQAITDKINAQQTIAGSILEERHKDCDGRHLDAINPATSWELQLAHAEEMGAGSRSYELVTVE